MDFKNIKPILNFPLACFPNPGGRGGELYELRVRAVRTDGWFMVKCDAEHTFAGSFPLQGDHEGEYMLGRIQQSPSVVSKDVIRYEVFIHGGSKDATAFCQDEEELLAVIDRLDRRGMAFVIDGSAYWEATQDIPFENYFTDFPQDITFEMLFSDNTSQGNRLPAPLHNQHSFIDEEDDYYGFKSWGMQ